MKKKLWKQDDVENTSTDWPCTNDTTSLNSMIFYSLIVFHLMLIRAAIGRADFCVVPWLYHIYSGILVNFQTEITTHWDKEYVTTICFVRGFQIIFYKSGLKAFWQLLQEQNRLMHTTWLLDLFYVWQFSQLANNHQNETLSSWLTVSLKSISK